MNAPWHVWMSHVAHVNASWGAYESVTPRTSNHIRIWRICWCAIQKCTHCITTTQSNESWHAYKWVTYHMSMHIVSHMNESCQTHKIVYSVEKYIDELFNGAQTAQRPCRRLHSPAPKAVYSQKNGTSFMITYVYVCYYNCIHKHVYSIHKLVYIAASLSAKSSLLPRKLFLIYDYERVRMLSYLYAHTFV